LDFVLKDNGAYDPTAMKNAVRGGRNGNKAGKKDNKEKAGNDNRRGGRKDGSRKKPAEGDLIAEPMAADKNEEQPEKKKHRGGRRHRGASGEKLPQADRAAQPRSPRKAGNGEARSEHRDRGNDRGGDRDRHRSGRDNRQQNMRGGDRGRNREERRNGKEVDYHRVYVTGLNNAVWPDPPGYHERKERDEDKPKQAPTHRPRPHRKTEGGTANSK
jgi:ribonuclease R